MACNLPKWHRARHRDCKQEAPACGCLHRAVESCPITGPWASPAGSPLPVSSWGSGGLWHLAGHACGRPWGPPPSRSATQRSGQQQPHRHSCWNLLKSWRESTDDPASSGEARARIWPCVLSYSAVCNMIFMVWPHYKEYSSRVYTVEPLQSQKQETKTICTVRASNGVCLQNVLACILNAGYFWSSKKLSGVITPGICQTSSRPGRANASITWGQNLGGCRARHENWHACQNALVDHNCWSGIWTWCWKTLLFQRCIAQIAMAEFTEH